MSVAVILGAGFSYVGGLPLTRDLYDPSAPLPRDQSDLALENYHSVRMAFSRASSNQPGLGAEQWLTDLYADRDNPLQRMSVGTTWDAAVRYALARLVDLPQGTNSHYYYGIGSYRCHPDHAAFWNRIEQLGAKYIVTLNYDTLVEQALHTAPSRNRTAPRCRYGGFQHIQVVKKLNDVVTKKHELLQLGDDFVLYKLHGSINWAWEPHSPTLKIHQDVRAVFRADNKYGTPAIVPPIAEKEMPPEFGQVWNEARKVLSQSDAWIICGYSLPTYDEALATFFRDILRARSSTRLMILDPSSASVATRWQALGANVSITTLPGLPAALNHSWL